MSLKSGKKIAENFLCAKTLNRLLPLVLLPFLTSLIFFSCGKGEHKFIGNEIPLDRKPSDKGPYYISDILPVFQKNCSYCHSSGSPTGNWLDYQVAFAKRDQIYLRAVEKKDMPKNGTLNEDERSLISKWVQNGAPYSPPNVTSTTTTLPAPAWPFYKTEVLPILERKCKKCHGPNSPIGNWLDYPTAFGMRGAIYQHIIVLRDMPRGEIMMTDVERAMVGLWVLNGGGFEKPQTFESQ